MSSIAVCGICKRSPRAGQEGKRIRLTAEDITSQPDQARKYPGLEGGAGLYQCCGDCFADLHPVVAARMGKSVDTMAQHDCI